MKKNTENVISNDTTKGGFFGFFQSKPNDSLETIVQNTKSSEAKLISSYEVMDKIQAEYSKAYNDHLKNLELLDDRVNFNGMVNVFKKMIMKYNIKSGVIDKTSPILFRNYSIEGEFAPSAFRREHISKQIYFYMKKYFPPSDSGVIKYMNIENITTTSFTLNITTIDNKNYKTKITHEDYLVDKTEVKKTLKDIIHTTKKYLRRDSKKMSYNSARSISSKKYRSVKSSKKSKKSKKKVLTAKQKSAKLVHNSKQKLISKNKMIINNKKPDVHNNKEIDLFAHNNKKGLSKINSKLRHIFRSKKRSLLSIEKSKSHRDREKKAKENQEKKLKETLEKKEKEERDKKGIFPNTPEGEIDKKCSQYQDKTSCEADADNDCFFQPFTNKCRRNTRKQQGVPGAQQSTPYKLPSHPGAITIPELEPSDNLGEKTL